MKTDNAYAELNAEDTEAFNNWIDQWEANELAEPEWYDLYLERDEWHIGSYEDRNGI